MKVWVIGRNYPLPQNQMSGSFELEQAKMLAKSEELEVSYLAASLHPTKKIKNAGFQKWSEDGISVFSYSKFFVPRIYPLYFGKLRNKIWKSFLELVANETGMPDVIHLHYPVMLMLADVLKEYKKKKVKIVVTEHWTKVLAKKLDAYESEQQKKYVEFVDSYICVGNPLKKAVLEMTDSTRDIQVVPNVVNSLFQPLNEQHKGFEFICVGRLVVVKQFDKIIKVFADLFKGNRDIRLTVVGNGEENDNLNALIDQLEVSGQVKMTGSLSREDTAKAVAKADCLVCFSAFETFGVPIIEAWACGIPAIITTAAAVVTDELDEELGIEVDFKNVEALKDAMKNVYAGKEKYNKEYICNYAQEHFSEATIMKRLMEIYRQ